MKKYFDFEFDFIRKVKEMETIGEICKNYNIDYSNLMKNKVTKEKKKIIAETIAKDILYLYGYAVAYLTKGDENE